MTHVLRLVLADDPRLDAAGNLREQEAMVQGWRQRANGDPTIVYRSVRSAWEDVEVHIRSFYQRHPHPAIGSHLLLEAARTLEAIDGGHLEQMLRRVGFETLIVVS